MALVVPKPGWDTAQLAGLLEIAGNNGGAIFVVPIKITNMGQLALACCSSRNTWDHFDDLDDLDDLAFDLDHVLGAARRAVVTGGIHLYPT